jgi:uncharacterized protein (TIGR02246 family)
MSPDTTADELAIHRLAAAYTDAINRNDPVEAAETYALDGSLLMRDGSPLVGRDAVRAFLVDLLARYEYVAQMTPSGLVRLDGDTAAARWQVFAFQKPRDASPRLLIGRYEDEVVRTAEGWRFAHRRFTARYLGDPSLVGSIFPDRSIVGDLGF